MPGISSETQKDVCTVTKVLISMLLIFIVAAHGHIHFILTSQEQCHLI